MKDYKIGFGYDIHRLEVGDFIKLGGISFKNNYSIVAHSDGDIILHSLSQAILSSLGKDDIGHYFSNKDIKNKNLDSKEILNFALNLLKEEGYILNNVVITIISETPNINNIRDEIRNSISKLINLNPSKIAIHANTKEGCGEVGKKEAIECYTLISIIK